MTRFLTEAQMKKLSLLRYLLSHNNVADTKELAVKLHVTTKSISRYCRSLDEDCQALTDLSGFRVINRQGTLTLTSPREEITSYLLDRLTTNYAQDSVRVRIVEALLEDTFPNVAELAESLFLTPNTLYNHLYQLEPVLTPFDLTFNWQKQARVFNFSYEEKKMRYFSYLFYWKFFRGLVPIKRAQPFDTSISEKINTYFSPEGVIAKHHQFRYLVEITQWHMEKSHSLTLSRLTLEILRLVVAVKDYATVLESDSTKDLPETERLFFNLLVRLTISSSDSDTVKRQIVTAIAEQNSPVFQYLEDLHDHIVVKFDSQPTEIDSIDFYYYMLFLFLYNTELGVSFNNEFLDIFNFSSYKKEYVTYANSLKDIHSLLQHVTQRHGYPLQNEDLAYLIIWLFLTAQHTKDPLIVAINFSDNAIGESVIKNRLLQLFNPDSLNFTSQRNIADLVISDYAHQNDSTQDFFYMESLVDSFCWQRLFETIQKKLAHKML